MRIIDDWQFKFIEKSLYRYNRNVASNLPTDRMMVYAIDMALEFFKGESHEVLIKDFYFKVNETKSPHRNIIFRKVCNNILYIKEQTGWTMRREIVYRIAMNCYAVGLFNTNDPVHKKTIKN